MRLKILFVLLSGLMMTQLTHAKKIHISPELKIGLYNGFGLQVGLIDIYDFDVLYLSYGQTRYEDSVWDERLDSYRVGMQHMFGAAKLHGFQAEFGIVHYDGTKDFLNGAEHRSAYGASFGGSYVFQATKHLGLRAGFDLNYFGFSDTHIPFNLSPNFNLGVNFSF